MSKMKSICIAILFAFGLTCIGMTDMAQAGNATMHITLVNKDNWGNTVSVPSWYDTSYNWAAEVTGFTSNAILASHTKKTSSWHVNYSGSTCTFSPAYVDKLGQSHWADFRLPSGSPPFVNLTRKWNRLGVYGDENDYINGRSLNCTVYFSKKSNPALLNGDDEVFENGDDWYFPTTKTGGASSYHLYVKSGNEITELNNSKFYGKHGSWTFYFNSKTYK